MTKPASSVDVAVKFTEAWSSRDMDTAAQYVAHDVVFESPLVQLTGAEPYLEAVGQFAQAVTGLSIIAVVGEDERVMVMYDMNTGPFGTLRAVEYLVIQDNKIKSDTLVFDTHEVRKFQAAQASGG